mmetsp:Transcript_22059/g.54169  ORF Transcript_22059/g.54169 Transcript_22059/m.54169 type:complete len:205 (-) Transcript_22059:1038-1652(-)
MSSACRRMSARSRVISPRIRMASPGPGKGCRQTDERSMPSSIPNARTSSLKSSLSGSSTCSFILAGRPPTLWCVLMVAEGPLNDIDSITSGYSVPCRRKPPSTGRCSSLVAFSKHSMNRPPMILRFFSGSVTPLSASKNSWVASMQSTCRPGMCCLSLWMTSGPSCILSKPVSINTPWNLCPMALCSRAAATVESTPPLSAPNT